VKDFFIILLMSMLAASYLDRAQAQTVAFVASGSGADAMLFSADHLVLNAFVKPTVVTR
jgi:hypothetical protein